MIANIVMEKPSAKSTIVADILIGRIQTQFAGFVVAMEGSI